MATVKVKLEKGITIGVTDHLEAEIREATVGDVLLGTSESEQLYPMPDGRGFQLAASAVLTAINVLRRQMVRIGDYEGPFTLQVMMKLSSRDLNLLQAAANRLEDATLGVSKAGESGSAPAQT